MNIPHFPLKSLRMVSPVIVLACFVLITVIITSSSNLYAISPGVDFYSIDSPPPGMHSLEPLIGKWWNWWENHPASVANNWPECLKGSGGNIGNGKSIVFTPNPASAVSANAGAKNQKCELSSNQLLYLTIYPGECSTGAIPEDGPSKSPSSITPNDLLKCATDSNEVIKLMKVKVDGQDVSSHIIRQSTTQPFKFFIPQENAVAYKTPPSGGNNTSMAENYYLFFKPMPVGHHTIELEVIRVPNVSTQPVEHPIAKWDIDVTK